MGHKTMSSSYDHSSSDRGGTKTIVAVLGILLALLVGYVIGSYKPWKFYNWDNNSGPSPNVDRYKVPVGNAPVLGPKDAKVTLIAFSDYQCPYCGKAEETVKQVLKNYPRDVRFVFKHQPLYFHPMALPAARASLAAREQGEDSFWKYHSVLFEHQKELSEPFLEEAAKLAGLNVEKFKKDLTENQAKYEAYIHSDQAEATQFGATGTPTFFINGRLLTGAQPYEEFSKLIDEEIKTATQALKSGTKPEDLYSTLIENGLERKETQPNNQQPPKGPAPLPDAKVVYNVPVGTSPARGISPAKITIVEYSDFECPYCSRAKDTVEQIVKAYPNDVKIVFKQNPLPFHQNAQLAAEASLAANEQGKFWEMHDQLFAHQEALDRASIEAYAANIGLSLSQFKQALDSGKFKAQVESEKEEAARLGARGTPYFFINGKPFRGAKPFEDFKRLIDREMALAEEKMNGGVKLADLYQEITKAGLTQEPKVDMPNANEGVDGVRAKVPLSDSPSQGPKDAKVTIVEFSDFQCPYCSRVLPLLKQVKDAYPKDVRVVFKQFPLPMHPHAHLAAEASLAAREQGKFWEMHDRLFANQQFLDEASIERYAKELGLNVERFRDALRQGKFKALVDKEMQEGVAAGVNGTPTLFINGKRVDPMPFDQLKIYIERALKEADDLMKTKKLNPGQVYEELMKMAPETKQAAGSDAAEPSSVKVDPGNGPSFGPKNAKVTIVEFSDFQCPYCREVTETIQKIKQKYANQVRFVFRNYPLSFHPHAQLAAEAAMAAHAQGKFWQMHDKLFANQQALDRASIENYASQIGLNMNRFKTDLDSGTYSTVVKADVTYANGLPGDGVGTPTFFINGYKIAGAYPFEEFDRLIQKALAEAKS